MISNQYKALTTMADMSYATITPITMDPDATIIINITLKAEGTKQLPCDGVVCDVSTCGSADMI